MGRKQASFISGHMSRKSDLEILAENLNLRVAEEKDCNSQQEQGTSSDVKPGTGNPAYSCWDHRFSL